MNHEHPLDIPHVRREQELLIVGFHDGEKYHEFGVDSEFMSIDDVDMWTHEFSERTIHEKINGGHLPISISIFPSQIPFRVHHLMVSLHTPSVLRIEDENGNTIRRRFLAPEEFDELIKWRNQKPELQDKKNCLLKTARFAINKKKTEKWIKSLF